MSEDEPRNTKPDRKKSGRVRQAADAAQPWSFPVPLAEIAAAGKHVELTADAATRDAVAEMAGIVAVLRLQAKFDLVPLAGEGVKVSGSVSATVEQECVVTLELLRNEIDEPVDLILVQPDALPPPRPALDIDVEGERDMPDILHGRAVDLGAIATEFLVLGIDPYPRKPGASFEKPPEPDSPADHPFAILSALKKDSGGKAS